MLLGVDVGGTFTDAVLVAPDGRLHTAKVPSTPARESAGVLDAVRLVLARAGAGPEDVSRFSHGMTVATNALLEGRGAKTALIATLGFTDVIELGRQGRAHLYRLCQSGPPALVPAELRFGAPERMTPEGPLRELSEDDARELLARVAALRPDAVAVSLLHSYAHPEHEQMLGRLLAQLLPDAHVSLSSDLVGTFREYERTATTALDAALSPLLEAYLAQLCRDAAADGLPEPEVMQSSGGLTDAARAGAHAALTVLSGPAGGVGGALLLARLADEPRVLCFDMGGTSCDVCLIDGHRVPETAERLIAGRPLALPALDIHTVGAGGGSIAWRDAGGALRVGPASAGADPGPACYGRGGTRPTVTDANLLLGRLLHDAPLAGGLQLDRDAAVNAVGALARELSLDVRACAEGIVRVAEAEMLGALRLMTVQRGIDPRDFALLPFGGAGPLHAAALAAEMGISSVLCPRTSGVLSALGLAAAAPRRDIARTLMLAGPLLTAERLRRLRAELLERARADLGTPPLRARCRYELRYRGQSFELPVEEDLDPARPAHGLQPEELREEFALAHLRRYGYRDDHADVELVNLRLSAWGPAPALRPSAGRGSPDAAGGDDRPGAGASGALTRSRREVVFADGPLDTDVLVGLPPAGTALEGPALCALPEATLLVPPGWAGTVDDFGTIRISRRGSNP